MPTACLYGAIAGDIIGSRFEHQVHKSEEFELFTPSSRFTDDTVLTIALADAILSKTRYEKALLSYGRRYPHAGYGGSFYNWLHSADPQPYNSFGNGSAMRVSSIGWAFNNFEDVLREAELSARPTHDHPEGIKGAQAAALAIFLARKEVNKTLISQEITARFGYDLKPRLSEIRPGYEFDVTCQGTLPAALIAFLESSTVEDAIRKAISLGGDADTLAAITGSIAEAYYGGVPDEIKAAAQKRLPQEFVQVLERFSQFVSDHS